MPATPVVLPQVAPGQGAQITHTNAVHSLLDGLDHVAGGQVDFNAEYGPANSGTANDQPLLQAAVDDLSGNDWLKLSGSYGLSSPLIVDSSRKLRGPATLVATTAFDFSQTVNDGGNAQGYGVAMVMTRNSGLIYTLGKLFLDNITLDGQRRTGSRGLLANLQQPGYFNGLRINNCLDYGMKLRGQQHLFYNTEIVEGNQGIVFDNASFDWFYGLNIERCLVACVTDTRDGNAGGTNMQIYGGHFELGNESTWDGAKAFWFTNTGATKLFGIRSSQRNGQTFMYADAFGTTRPQAYSIYGCYTSGATTTGTAIEDVDLGLTGGLEKMWWADYRGSITEFHSPNHPTSQSFNDPHPFLIAGVNGRRLAYGGTRNAVPTMDFTPATTQTAAQTIWRDSAGVARFSVGKAGHPNLPVYSNATRPAATTVVAGTVIWNSDDLAPNYSDATAWRDSAGAVT